MPTRIDGSLIEFDDSGPQRSSLTTILHPTISHFREPAGTAMNRFNS